MLAFTCALAASATWLMIATKNSWPVSTTYSIVAALAGAGVAAGGPSGVQWGWNGGKGLATIFAGFGIAPAISAAFGSVIYLITKYSVLERKESLRKVSSRLKSRRADGQEEVVITGGSGAVEVEVVAVVAVLGGDLGPTTVAACNAALVILAAFVVINADLRL